MYTGGTGNAEMFREVTHLPVTERRGQAVVHVSVLTPVLAHG